MSSSKNYRPTYSLKATLDISDIVSKAQQMQSVLKSSLGTKVFQQTEKDFNKLNRAIAIYQQAMSGSFKSQKDIQKANSAIKHLQDAYENYGASARAAIQKGNLNIDSGTINQIENLKKEILSLQNSMTTAVSMWKTNMKRLVEATNSSGLKQALQEAFKTDDFTTFENKLSSIIQATSGDLDRLKTSFKDLKDQKNTLTSLMNGQKGRITQNQNAQSLRESNISSTTAEMAKKEQELITLQQKLNQEMSKAKLDDSSIKQALKEYQSLEKEIDNISKKITTINSKYSDTYAKKAQTAVKNNISSWGSSLGYGLTNRQLGSAFGSSGSFDKLLSSIKKNIGNGTSTKTSINEKEIEKIKNKYQELSSSLKKATQEVEKFNKANLATNQTYQKDMSNLDTLQKKLETLKKSQTALYSFYGLSQGSKATSSQSAFNSELNKKQASFNTSETQKKINELNASIEKDKKRLDELNNELSKFKETESTLKTSYNTNKKKMEELNTQIDQVKAALRETQTKKNYLTSLSGKATATQPNTQATEQQIADKKQQISNLQTAAQANAAAKATKDLASAQSVLSGAIERSTASSQKQLTQWNKQISAIDRVNQAFDNFKYRLSYILGFTSLFYKMQSAIRSTFTDLQELDEAFASIAMVTDYSVSGMWKSYDKYSQMAAELGQSTKDVIEASALYYQQGLDTNESLELTESTMKLATLAGSDFSEATSNMTAA